MTEKTKPKLGLLPLYIKLYDDVLPDARRPLDEFVHAVGLGFQSKGLDVVAAPVCRVKSEFENAVRSLESAGADAIVTLHMAYSPSLESADALASTDLPLIVLDTTPTYQFGPEQNPDEIMFNHGVQDLCNLLIRRGKPFQITAGHWQESDVMDRAADWVRAAQLARRMRCARVGAIGGPFVGMGDFQVSQAALASIGIQSVPADLAKLASDLPPENDPAVAEEMSSNLADFESDGLDAAAHMRAVKASIAVRRWIERESLTAWTMNFNAIDRSSGLPTLPFLEASKGMARGIGYAGEGDVLTAALVGALASVHPETTFTEMFCADWAGDRIFVSHMGELNPDLVIGRAELVEKPMPFLNTDSPALLVGRFRGGEAVFVNLAPGPDDTFTLILAPIEMLEDGKENMPATVRGWFRSALPVPDFLEAYSSVGGTHHAAAVYGDVLFELTRFGELMGWDVAIIG
jgi:L-arabinose isomerase